MSMFRAMIIFSIIKQQYYTEKGLLPYARFDSENNHIQYFLGQEIVFSPLPSKLEPFFIDY